MMNDKPTLVLGASTNIERYSNIAIKKLLENNFLVFGVGNKAGKVENVAIEKDLLPLKNIHTVTIYLSKQNQIKYYDYILSLNPKRIIFNPGAENIELFELALQNNIEPINACTLVMLSTKQY